MRGLGCVNQACTRARITQPSPHIFLHICISSTTPSGFKIGQYTTETKGSVKMPTNSETLPMEVVNTWIENFLIDFLDTHKFTFMS